MREQGRGERSLVKFKAEEQRCFLFFFPSFSRKRSPPSSQQPRRRRSRQRKRTRQLSRRRLPSLRCCSSRCCSCCSLLPCVPGRVLRKQERKRGRRAEKGERKGKKKPVLNLFRREENLETHQRFQLLYPHPPQPPQQPLPHQRSLRAALRGEPVEFFVSGVFFSGVKGKEREREGEQRGGRG